MSEASTHGHLVSNVTYRIDPRRRHDLRLRLGELGTFEIRMCAILINVVSDRIGPTLGNLHRAPRHESRPCEYMPEKKTSVKCDHLHFPSCLAPCLLPVINSILPQKSEPWLRGTPIRPIRSPTPPHLLRSWRPHTRSHLSTDQQDH